MNAFVILGHGEEAPIAYESRFTMPADTYLVTSRQCGMAAISTEDMFPLLTGMLEVPDLFLNPIDNKKKIESVLGKQIRIHRPGDPYPALSVRLLIDATTEEGPILSKSGIYKLPLKREDFLLRDGKFTLPVKRNMVGIRNPNGEVQRIYRGSVYPTEASLPAGDYIKTLGSEFSAKLDRTLQSIFEEFGPGVYYYPVCRSLIKPDTSSDVYEIAEIIVSKHEEEDAKKEELIKRIQQIKKEAKDVDSTNTLVPLRRLYLLLTPYADKLTGERLEMYTELKKIVETVPAIRSQSTLRQRGRRRQRRRKTNRRQK